MNTAINYEDQPLEDYLFERFREDRIEKEIGSLIALNIEKRQRQSDPSNPTKKLTTNISRCENCPAFEGWKDPLGIPVVGCRFYKKHLPGMAAIELFDQVHPGSTIVAITIKRE